jgi:hypothetical protein
MELSLKEWTALQRANSRVSGGFDARQKRKNKRGLRRRGLPGNDMARGNTQKELKPSVN